MVFDCGVFSELLRPRFVRRFDDDLEEKAANNPCNYAVDLAASFCPSDAAVVADRPHKEDGDEYLKQDQHSQVANIDISLTHVVALLNLESGYRYIDTQTRSPNEVKQWQEPSPF